jgi:uncharacterized surface protein with fasciclin (FAS1) repeats
MSYNAPNSQGLNYTHMFDIPDLRGCLPTKVNEGTILDFLVRNKDATMFYNLVILGKFDDLLNMQQADYTIFIPSDKSILDKYGKNIFENYDIGDARSYIKASTLNSKITSELLNTYSHLYTIDKITRLNINIQPDSNIYVNCNARILKPDILLKNGVIHIIDDKINLLEFTRS